MKSEILVMDCEERGNFWLTLKSDYKILFATTAEEGLEMLSDKVGLVFLNMKLPDMKSMEVFRLIKKEHPSAAVIIITACGTGEESIEPFRKEANDYAQRPLEAEDILQKIRTLVSMSNDAQKQAGGSFPEETVQDEQYPDIPPHVAKGVLRVRDFLTHNYSESLTLSAACKMASVSKTYFCHFFKRITGHSLRSYQHAVKMEMAGELLRDRRLSVKEVARRLGYSDPNYFSTIYKRITGNSPRQRGAHGRSVESERGKEKEEIRT
jgi:two-component system response regulator YesN